MATRRLDWLRVGASSGARVLHGDPGRTYLPRGLQPVATYRVQTSRELESAESKESAVYAVATEA